MLLLLTRLLKLSVCDAVSNIPKHIFSFPLTAGTVLPTQHILSLSLFSLLPIPAGHMSLHGSRQVSSSAPAVFPPKAIFPLSGASHFPFWTSTSTSCKRAISVFCYRPPWHRTLICTATFACRIWSFSFIHWASAGSMDT